MFPFRRRKPADTSDVSPARLEAFSDGVIAIIITIMVLELKVPHDVTARALLPLWPVFISYALSFFYIATYWINHHHLFHFVKHVSTPMLWTNLLFLFFLSLIPFFTAYVGENNMQTFPVMLYAVMMMACSVSFLSLRIAVASQNSGAKGIRLLKVAGTKKNWLSSLVYLAALPLAFVHPAITMTLILLVGFAYVIPPRWDKDPYSR